MDKTKLKKLLTLDSDPKLAIFDEISELNDKVALIKEVLSEINVKEVKTYENELENLSQCLTSLKESLDGKDMVVNIPLDSLAENIKSVEQAIKGIKEVKIPEVKFPTEYPLSELQINELLLAINTIPEFPIDDLEKMVLGLGSKIEAIKLEVPENKFDYEFLDDKFKDLIRAVKNVSITVSGGGGGIGERANENLDAIKTNTEGLAKEAKQDTAIANQTNGTQKCQILASDTPIIDAFGRLRVSNPTTLFDSKQIHNDPDLADTVENQPLFYDNQQTAGSGTSTSYNVNTASTTLSVSADILGTRVRQSKMRFNYQPGKSIQVLMTFTFSEPQVGITCREGQYDDKNGLFLECKDAVVSFVRRTYVTGTAVDNKVTQANWSLDKMDGTGPSGITLDLTKTQILFIDYEWLGVGRVRMGFVVDGLIYYAHEFLNANILTTVYMSTPNLPLRSEILNDGNGGAASMTQICSTVISEGGLNELGTVRYASTNGTHLDANTENTIYAVLGIRQKAEYLSETIKILNTVVQIQTGGHRLEWMLILNPTVDGTFTYVGEPQSAIEIARGATANTVTGGYKITGGFAESGGVQGGNAGSVSAQINNALLLGSLIDGTADTMVLCVRPIGGSSNVDVEGSITWTELS